MTNNVFSMLLNLLCCTTRVKEERSKEIKKKYEEEISKHAKEVACEGREEHKRMKESTYEKSFTGNHLHVKLNIKVCNLNSALTKNYATISQTIQSKQLELHKYFLNLEEIREK